MSLNQKLSYLKKSQSNLKNKLLSEGLTKSEMRLLNEISSLINEAPISYGPEVGGARMSPNLQGKIERGEIPSLSSMGLNQAQVDFFTSEAFKFSVKRLEELLNEKGVNLGGLNANNINLKRDAMTAFGTMMRAVGKLMSELQTLQYNNKEELEEIAVESVEKVMGIDREFYQGMLKLDGELTYGFLSKLPGMKAKTKQFSDKEILDAFADIDSEKVKKLEALKQDFESMGVEFDEEKAKQAIESTFEVSPETLKKAKEEFSDIVKNRMIINLFRRGMALNFSDAYKVCEDKIRELPDGDRILEISNVLQAIMLHMYWLFPDIGGVGTSGSGQIGQVEVLSPEEAGESGGGNEFDDDDEFDDDFGDDTPSEESDFGGAFVVRAKASTLPLLVHELVKGVIMFFTSAGGSSDEGKLALAKKASTSLEIEAYDLTFSEPFFLRFYQKFERMVPDENERRDLTPFVLKYFSEADDNPDAIEKGKLQRLSRSLVTSGLEDGDFVDDFIEDIIAQAREAKEGVEEEFPEYKKKKYENPEDEDDDLSWV
jgi:hypothetical protein